MKSFFWIVVIIVILSCNSEGSVKNSYWSNGRIKTQEHLDGKGELFLVEKYDSLGNIYSKAKYANNKRNGEFTFYYPSGKVKEESYCLNDSLDGKYIEYYENGVIKCTGYYKGNKGYGNTECFDERGHLISIFHNYSAKTSLSGEFDSNGKVLSTYPFMRIGMKSDTILNGDKAVLMIKIYNREMLDSVSVQFDKLIGIADTPIENSKDSIAFTVPKYNMGRNLITGEFKSRIKDDLYDTSIVYINVKIYQPFFVKNAN